jgi:hypothetical protein
MSESNLWPAAAAGLLACLAAAPAAAGAQRSSAKPDAAVATCESVPGALLQREGPDKWRPVAAKGTVRDGALLVALPEAVLVSANGAVQLKLMADIGKRGPFPVLEPAVSCQKAGGDVDFDVTVDRGIAVFTNAKKKGAAKVRLRIHGHEGQLILNEPGAKVGIELYGRQPPGEPVFEKGAGGEWTIKDTPVVDVFLIVVKGTAYVQFGENEWRLTAPPGNAALHYNSAVRKTDVERMEKLPDSLVPMNAEEKKRHEDLCAVGRRLTTGDLDKTLHDLLTSDNDLQRRAAVVVLGALDKLPPLFEALADPKHADVRQMAILVLRHWIGRAPGQATKLFNERLQLKKTNVVRAKNRLHLLYGFTEQEQKEAGTYEMLLTYLQHEEIPIREVAHWHLVRLVPQGKKIPYDAAAPPEQRARAVAQWRALIPEGRLPPPPDKK